MPAWLTYDNNNIINFLCSLDSKNDPSIGCRVLKEFLFQHMEIHYLIKQLPINPDTKLIPMEQLTSENVLFWRCFAQFFQKKLSKKCNTDLSDDIIPELCYLCDYIRAYEEHIIKKKDNVKFNENTTQQAILYQLFKMIKLYNLSDQVERNYLKKFIEDTLLRRNIADVKLIEFIVYYYEEVVPDVTVRISTLSHIINGIKMLSNYSSDDKTMIKCHYYVCNVRISL